MNTRRIACQLALSLVTVLVATRAEIVAEDAPTISSATQEVLQILANYRVRMVAKPSAGEVTLVPRPLLTFGDAARDNEAGTLWVWTAAGRPIAFVENYRPVGDATNWVQALTLSSSSLLEMGISTNQTWKPNHTHIKIQPCPADLADVATTPVQRLRQMKDISRRFKAHEFWDPNNSRFELRCLTQPVFRYGAAESPVVDAATFVFAHGTNPEALLLLEAVREGETSRWKYGWIRLGSAEMHAALDDREVWTVPRTPGVVGQPVDPYWLCILPNPTAPKN